MIDHELDDIDPRLGRFFASEVVRAEADVRARPFRTRDRHPQVPFMTFTLIAAVLGFVVIGSSFLLRSTGPGGSPLGVDGIPTAFDGEAVLRGDAITARLAGPGDGEAFLAGGFVVFTPTRCRELVCDAGWSLETDAAGSGEPGFPLMTIAGGATIVPTTGAATVFRVDVAADATRCGPLCPDTLLVRATVWRQPTKGPVPDEATPPEGGDVNMALVPDFVAYSGRESETIIGYIVKGDLLSRGGIVPGSPSDPPQSPPIAVYAEDLVTVIGQDVPGRGFIAAGATIPPASSPPFGDPSVGPSIPTGVEYLADIPIAIDGEPVLVGGAIGQVFVERGRSFLVTGILGNIIFDCVTGACPESAVLTLRPPGDREGGHPGRFLLDENGTWGPPSQDRWPGDLVVLRVRAYDLDCPWMSFCDDALLVEAWIPAP